MKIAFFVHSFPEISETFILRQVIGLLDRGHDVRIFAHTTASDGPAHESVATYGLRDRVRVLAQQPHAEWQKSGTGSERWRRALSSARRRTSALGVLIGGRPSPVRDRGALARAQHLLRSEGRCDIVHCHYGDIGLHYGAAARLWGVPLIVSFYGYDCSSYPRSHGHDVFVPLFGVASAVTSLSEHMDDRLRRLGCPAELLRRIPLAIDPSPCERRINQATRAGATARLLTVGRLAEKKGIEFGLRAVALVVSEFPGLRYDIIGDGPLRLQLEDLAKSLGLESNVHFSGFRTDQQVRAAMCDADLFLLPSVTAADGDEEGTPTAIIEAAYHELPVLSTLHAGVPELVLNGESGYLVPERDVAALGERLRALLRSPERWKSMGHAGRQLVEESHTRAAVAERLEQLYVALRQSGRASS